MTEQKRGRLRLIMGYAPGVGKTYKMLEEGQALKGKGLDVVIGYFEPHGRKDTIARMEGLETVPRAKLQYRGASFEEMDTEAILARRPQVCLVDEYAHTNVPGSPRAKRWEDVELLLEAGLDVLTTMNIQHLESLNDVVYQISGVRVRETIPDWVVRQAQGVVLMDLTPRALLHRLERGVVYDREKVQRARQNFFQESTLVALRELALRETAHELEHRVIEEGKITSEEDPYSDGKQHRILVLITAETHTAMAIRRARRMSDFLETECLAVALRPTDEERVAVEKHLYFAKNLRIKTEFLEGNDPAQAVVDFARKKQITQIYLARPPERRWTRILSRGLLQRIVALAKDMQIVIISERDTIANQR
jgi:two-component system, OmpR family, sensor histidine kinase KdpD